MVSGRREIAGRLRFRRAEGEDGVGLGGGRVAAAEVVAGILGEEIEAAVREVCAPWITDEDCDSGSEAAVEKRGHALGEGFVVEKVADEDDVSFGWRAGGQVLVQGCDGDVIGGSVEAGCDDGVAVDVCGRDVRCA